MNYISWCQRYFSCTQPRNTIFWTFSIMKNAAYFRKRCLHKTWECKPAVQYVTINLNNNLHNFTPKKKKISPPSPSSTLSCRPWTGIRCRIRSWAPSEGASSPSAPPPAAQSALWRGRRARRGSGRGRPARRPCGSRGAPWWHRKKYKTNSYCLRTQQSHIFCSSEFTANNYFTFCGEHILWFLQKSLWGTSTFLQNEHNWKIFFTLLHSYEFSFFTYLA